MLRWWGGGGEAEQFPTARAPAGMTSAIGEASVVGTREGRETGLRRRRKSVSDERGGSWRGARCEQEVRRLGHGMGALIRFGAEPAADGADGN